jgi:hypothetical protein
MSAIKTETDLIEKIMDFIVAKSKNEVNKQNSISKEIGDFLKLNPSYNSSMIQLQNKAYSLLVLISEKDLTEKMKNKIIAERNNETVKKERLNFEIGRHLTVNPKYFNNQQTLQKKANEQADAEMKEKDTLFSKETAVKMKAKIYVNNFYSIIYPKKEQDFKNDNLKLENLIKAKPIPAELIDVIDNEAKDNAIIKILRVMKKPDGTSVNNLINANVNLDNEIKQINKSVTLSRAQRNANQKTVQNKINQMNANKGPINEYNMKLNDYNINISPKISKLNEYITNTFGTYYSGDKKVKLEERSNSSEIIQEFYENVMLPKSHIGVM